jgi:hypothetical protein
MKRDGEFLTIASVIICTIWLTMILNSAQNKDIRIVNLIRKVRLDRLGKEGG